MKETIKETNDVKVSIQDDGRRVFYINVGDMPKQLVEEYTNAISAKYKTQKPKKVKPTGVFHIKVDIGNLPATRAQDYMNSMRDGFKKAFKKHGTTVITGYHGQQQGNVEIIRIA